jgi:hypothetical protein
LLKKVEFRDASLPGYELGSRGIELRESLETAVGVDEEEKTYSGL